MNRTLRFDLAAQHDLQRLADFLSGVSPSAAVRAAQSIRSSIRELNTFPEQGKAITRTIRQLIIPFGDSGYVVHYRIDPKHIVIARVFHMREDR